MSKEESARDGKLYRKMQGDVEESVAVMFRNASKQAQLIRQMVDAAAMAGCHAEIMAAQDRIYDTEGLLRSVEIFLTQAHDVRSLYRNYKALSSVEPEAK